MTKKIQEISVSILCITLSVICVFGYLNFSATNAIYTTRVTKNLERQEKILHEAENAKNIVYETGFIFANKYMANEGVISEEVANKVINESVEKIKNEYKSERMYNILQALISHASQY